MFIHPSNTRAAFCLMAGALFVWPLLAFSSDAVKTTPAPSAMALMTQDLISGPNKEVVMLELSYPAGGASLPHRHNAQVFVYVLEGELSMQVQGGPLVTLRPGQTFYEAPADVHLVSGNASKTSAARFLVVMVKDKDKPVSSPAAR